MKRNQRRRMPSSMRSKAEKDYQTSFAPSCHPQKMLGVVAHSSRSESPECKDYELTAEDIAQGWLELEASSNSTSAQVAVVPLCNSFALVMFVDMSSLTNLEFWRPESMQVFAPCVQQCDTNPLT
eukprot:1993057-Amphidinium_carterae.1